MMHFYPDENDDVARPVIAIGHDYPDSFELAEHRHRRSQFLYAASGVMAVSTPSGAWVAPPERAVWIPGGTPHSVRMVGAVQTRSVLVEPGECPGRGLQCQVVGVSPLLRQLLSAAAHVTPEYDVAGRDGLVMHLLMAEIDAAPPIPLAVPFPSHPALARRCHAFLKRPNAAATIDEWADDGNQPPQLYAAFPARDGDELCRMASAGLPVGCVAETGGGGAGDVDCL